MLEVLKRSVPFDEQGPISEIEDEIHKMRDDLLHKMFKEVDNSMPNHKNSAPATEGPRCVYNLFRAGTAAPIWDFAWCPWCPFSPEFWLYLGGNGLHQAKQLTPENRVISMVSHKPLKTSLGRSSVG